ncbi:hypothetical protein HYH02_000635 [Chlamydomonas schloesseri]|uniref:Serine aminopeptidase S33 domain-containing protein n=1 Tax=Chlamydomonas schloesseri TaxID=2026947 RepID=A0A835WX60_9CHLO|nr:hypothetical protein HYH02_000635 [Chlamydomonas schloesseri]|eukprot:KAG2454803.1 hypothetical protein HYH02_000635 [Chlamydomonas schloesseri]
MTLVYDSRGLGRSTCQVADRQTTTLLAADAQAVVDSAWGADSRFCLYGISLGGMIAQELMYRLVASGQGARILAASLHVTSPGSWLRLPWFLQLPLMLIAFKPPAAPVAAAIPSGTKKGGGGAMFADDADFAARYSLDTLFGKAWLEGPAPPEAIDPAAPTAPVAMATAAAVSASAKRPTTAAAAGLGGGAADSSQLHISVEAGRAPAGAGDNGSSLARREAVWRVLTAHWRETLAMHAPVDYPAVACQVTAVLGRYLQPHKAAAIRFAGLRIGVGVSTRDAFFPEAAQRQLATALGAEVVQVTGAGHLDGIMLDGVYSVFDGGLGSLLTISK